MAEQFITNQIMDEEVTKSKSNAETRNAEFELYVDMLECERNERNMDWMSDIYIPEFAAQMLTQSSQEANQYFQTREFVEVYIEDESSETILAADANKELVNRTLNQRHLRHYQKWMRANISKNLNGEVYIKCGWERKNEKRIKPFETLRESMEFDVNGNPLVDRAFQEPRLERVTEEREIDETVIDRFNYDIIDRRNVFTDNVYAYSLQDKVFVIIREEKTLDELKTDASQEGYKNLDKLKDVSPVTETETSSESYNKDDSDAKIDEPDNNPYDIYHRYGKAWATIKGRDRFGNPLPDKVDFGVDENGKKKDGAELVECIISIAVSGSTRQLIRFIATPFVDSSGFTYRPLIRGICYIHPTKDHGLGDGKYARELQTGINDTFNISNDRVSLATLPTMKGNKNSLEDNATVYFEPNHVIELEDTNDLVEMAISDNIQGAILQINKLTNAMSKVTGKFEPQEGGTGLASTTATAIAGAQVSSNKRDNYKALTFAYTFENDFYWMITQMTWQFANEDSGFKLMGEKLFNFNPSLEFTYKPLSQSTETEYSKANQIRELNQMLSVLAPVVGINPKGAQLINFILAKQFALYGDEYADFGKVLLDEQSPVGGQTGTNQPVPAQNQFGMQQSGMEQVARA